MAINLLPIVEDIYWVIELVEVFSIDICLPCAGSEDVVYWLKITFGV